MLLAFELPMVESKGGNEVALPSLSGAAARDHIPAARPCRGRAVCPDHWYLPVEDAPKV